METLVGSQEGFVGEGGEKAGFGMFLYSFQLVNYEFHMSDTRENGMKFHSSC